MKIINQFTKTIFTYVGNYGIQTDDNGLVYMRNRYYNQDIKRFITMDPIKDGFNWYGYVNGNPIDYIDPFGLARYGANGDLMIHYAKTYGVSSVIWKALDELNKNYDKALNIMEVKHKQGYGYEYSKDLFNSIIGIEDTIEKIVLIWKHMESTATIIDNTQCGNSYNKDYFESKMNIIDKTITWMTDFAPLSFTEAIILYSFGFHEKMQGYASQLSNLITGMGIFGKFLINLMVVLRMHTNMPIPAMKLLYI